MFEFGKDIRRLFEKAGGSEDLGWMEGISASLVENEARTQSLESGRPTCTSPFGACLRACLLWREHARRTGHPQSLQRAESEARTAIRFAVNEEQTVRATIELAQSILLAFDLIGGPDRLTATETLLKHLPTPRRQYLADEIKAVVTRVNARRATLDGDQTALKTACNDLEMAVQTLKDQHAHSDLELRIEQANLSLTIGLMTRDFKRLDKVGQELRNLVENAPGVQRPISRGRALAICGMGMLALANLAKDETARKQGLSLMQAATDQFVMDHSPLDWAAIQLMRADAEDSLSLTTVVQIEALTEQYGLVMGAEARERHLAMEIHEAEQAHDLLGLQQLEKCILSRLRDTVTLAVPLDWVSNQMGLARIALARARLMDRPADHLGLILIEAAETARERGASALASRARDLLPHPQTAL